MSFHLSEQELGMAMEVVTPLSHAYGRVVDPDDLFQTGILAINAGLHRYDPSRASISTFMSVIARNSMIDAVRREQRHRTKRADPEAIEEIPTETLEEAFEREADRKKIHEEIGGLGHSSKVILTDLFGLDGKEPISRTKVADAWEMSISTLRRKKITLLSLLGERLEGQLFATNARVSDTPDSQSQT